MRDVRIDLILRTHMAHREGRTWEPQRKLCSDAKQRGRAAAPWKRLTDSPLKGGEGLSSEVTGEGSEELPTAPWKRLVGSAFVNEPDSPHAPDPPALKAWRAAIASQVLLHEHNYPSCSGRFSNIIFFSLIRCSMVVEPGNSCRCHQMKR